MVPWASIIDMIVKLVGDWLKSLLKKTAARLDSPEDYDSPSKELLRAAHDSLKWRNFRKRAAIRRYIDLVPPVIDGEVRLTKAQKDEIKELGAQASDEK